MLVEEYRKEDHRTYLTFTKETDWGADEIGLQMLLQNEMKGVFGLARRSVDNQDQYFYDVTGYQKFSEVCQLKKPDSPFVQKILLEIGHILKNAAVYFLDADGFVLQPELMYLKKNHLTLCYCPEKRKDIREQFHLLMEWLVQKMDYGDEEVVSLVYRLYQASSESHFNPLEMEQALEDEDGFPTRDEWKRQREAGKLESWEYQADGRSAEARLAGRDMPEGKALDQKALDRNGTAGKGSFRKAANRKELDEDRLAGRTSYAKKFDGFEGKRWKVFLPLGGMLCVPLVFLLFYIQGFFVSVYTGQIETNRLLAVGIAAAALETYLAYRLVQAMVERKQMKGRDPHRETAGYGYRAGMNLEQETAGKNLQIQEEKTVVLAQMEPTVLLQETPSQEEEAYCLFPLEDGRASEIEMVEFPFFLGKAPVKGRTFIENRAVSRFHAKIEKEGENLYLTDLNSTNGTFINHIRLEANQPKLLQLGDEVMLADSVYRFSSRCFAAGNPSCV